MKISIIVACSSNQVIGVDNQLPWHLPADLAYFKKLTTGHPILMGRKTYESIGRPLPNRKNIVITRNKNFSGESLFVFHSLDEAIQDCRDNHYPEIFIIGGDNIYQQSLDVSNKIYLTRVHTLITEGTAFFPELDPTTWTKISSEKHVADEKNQFDYDFEVYEKNMPHS